MHTHPRLTPLSKALLMSQALRVKPVFAAIGFALSLPVAMQVQAQEVEFNIPAQPLGSALNELGHQSGLRVLYSPDDVQGKTSGAVQGRLAPAQAAGKLLSGAGIAYSLQGDTLTLSATDSSAAVNLAATSINAQHLGTSTDGTGSYTTGAVTINKTAQSLRKTPQSVSVVTSQQIQDKNLTSLDKVMAQATGITFAQRNLGSHVYLSRGFSLNTESYLVDGIPGQAQSFTGWMKPDTAVFDRVEILRGAAGMVVGAGNPGGAVNLVRKRPTADPHFSITTRAGSYDTYRMDLDGSGRLNDSGSVRGRMVAAYEDRGYNVDLMEKTTPLIYGIVEADVTDDTTLTLSLRHETSDTKGYTVNGLPRYSNGDPLHLSSSTSLGQNWNRHQTEMNEVFGELEHRFNDDWSAKVSASHSEGRFDQRVAFARGAVNPTTLTGSRLQSVLFRHDEVESSGVDGHLDGKFDAFGLTHQLTVGANWSRQDYMDKQVTLPVGQTLDVFNPNHAAIAEPVRPAWNIFSPTEDVRKGVYSNMRIQLTEPLSLLIGGRLSWYDYTVSTRGTAAINAKQNAEFTPFAGLVYDLDDDWSLYASYADIFLPQSSSRNAAGGLLDPAIGSNYETGIKGELFDKRMNVSFALFYIKQKDVSVEDVANSGKCLTNDSSGTCYLNGAVVRSKGFETEVSGEVLPGLQMIAGYTFNQTSSEVTQGSLSSETPKHLLRMSSNYTLPGNWNRLSVGAGVSAQSGYVDKTFDPVLISNSGRAIWDAKAAWKIDQNWKVGLNVDNLLNRKYYYATGATDRGNYYGDPRSFTVTLRGDF